MLIKFSKKVQVLSTFFRGWKITFGRYKFNVGETVTFQERNYFIIRLFVQESCDKTADIERITLTLLGFVSTNISLRSS